MSASAQSNPQQRYHAFISYRHADNHAPGRQWATWLHQALETYEVPADLVGTKNSRGETIPSRIFPVFRDEDELPAHANLGDSIVLALEQSELLLVICSPAAVASTYVANEIERFKQLGGSDRILAVIIDGEPNAGWDSAKWDDRITAEHECFPEPLQFVYTYGVRTTARAEPIAADFRVNHGGHLQQGWTSPEAYRQWLIDDGQLTGKAIEKRVASYLEQQQLMLLKIIAGVLAVPLGQLTRRDRAHQLKLAEQRARKLRRWLFAVSMLAITALLAGGIAVKQTRQAKQRTHEAQVAESSLLAGQSTQALKRADYEQALKLAVAALPNTLDNPDRAFAKEAEIAMIAAVYRDKLVFRDVSDPAWDDHDALRKQPYSATLLREGSRLLLTGPAAPMLINTENFSRIKLRQRPSTGEHWTKADISADEQFVTASTAGNAYVWSLNDGQLILSAPGDKSGFARQSDFVVVTKKNKTAVSELINLQSKTRAAEYAGQVMSISTDNDSVIAEIAPVCEKVESSRWGIKCTPHEVIQYGFSGEITQRVPGELLRIEADSDTLFVVNRPQSRFRRSISKSRPAIETVSSISLNNFTTNFEITGSLQLFDSDSQRAISEDSHSGKLLLWNMADGKQLASINAGLQREEVGLYKGPIEVHFNEAEQEKFVLISRQSATGKQVGQWYFQTDRPPEFQNGNYVGLTRWGGLVSSFETDTATEIFIDSDQRTALTMPVKHCGQSDEPSFGTNTRPTMGNDLSSMMLFQCSGHLALFFPEVGGMQFLETTGHVNWVNGGDYFSVENSVATFWAPQQWQGGDGYVEKRLTVKAGSGENYQLLAGGRYLMALDDLSGVRIWDFFRFDATADASLDNESVENDIKLIDKDQEAEFLRDRDEQLQTFAKLGFPPDSLRKGAEQYWASFNLEPTDFSSEWTLATPFEPSQTLVAKAGFSPDWQIQLDKHRRIVGIDSKSVLVDSRLPQAMLLSESQRLEQFGIDWLDTYAPAGIQLSPDGNSWLFFNQFEMALYDNSGQRLKSLCVADEPCETDLNIQWVNGGAGLYHLGAAPSLYSIEQRREIDICRAYASAEICRQLYSTGPLFGQQNIVTQYLMADLETALPMRQLNESQFGFGGIPLHFNDDETAVLMADEDGGGMVILSAWKLPERGQQMLKKANSRISTLYATDPH